MRSRGEGLVWIATFVYAGVFFLLGADRYATFHSGADLGLFAQTIASAFSGFHNTFEATSHFAYHFSPILYLCAPLMWLAHSALALVFIQAVATALVAPALYRVARRRTGELNAAAIACIALLYPPLQGVTFTDFHEMAFVPAAVAWLLYALDARRYGLAYAMLVVALCTKEDQAPAMAFVGIASMLYFARRGERGGVTFGAIAIAASALTFGGYFALVRPLAGAPAAWVPKHFYAWGGYAHADPIAKQIAGRLTYLAEAFVPLALIPLRSRVAILALPGLLEVLASREPLMYTMGQHYAAAWVPYVLVAFAVASAKLLEGGGRGRLWVRTSAALCAITLAFFSPLHLGHFLRATNAADAATESLIARLPRDAAIGTYDEIYAHLGFYPNAQVGLRGEPQYVLMDERYASAAWNSASLPVLRRDVGAGIYQPIVSQDGVTLFERRR